MTRAQVGVIFDLDGVLVDSEPYWQLGFSLDLSQILADRDYGTFDLRPGDMGRYQGGRVPDTILEILGDLGLADRIDADERREIVDEVISSVTGRFVKSPTPIRDGVDTARALARDGIALAVASSSALPFIDAALHAIQLSDAFIVRTSAVPLKHGKPDPEVYLLACKALGLEPDHCLAIEDSPRGVAAAVNADLRCLWYLPRTTRSGRRSWKHRRRTLVPQVQIRAGSIKRVRINTLVSTERRLSADRVRTALLELAARGNHES